MEALLRTLLFLPEPGTPEARSIDRLHFFVITVTFIGAAVVGFAALAFLIRYRSTSTEEHTVTLHAPRWLEFGVGGTLLAIFVLWWVIGYRQYARLKEPTPASLEVYVTAKQWMWKFSNANGRERSAGVLVVSRGQTVRLLITSRDVVHSFYVPAFRIKQDAVPGRYTSIWFRSDRSGIYPVYCAEYCGVDHSRMWASVVVLEAPDYSRWLDGDLPKLVAHAGAQPELHGGVVGETGLTSMADEGREAASRYACFSCHTIDGQAHIGPTWQGLYGSVVELEDGRFMRADENYLTRSMMDPVADVVKGFKPVMPVYQGTLEQPDAAAIVEFIKSLRFDTSPPSVLLPPVVPAPTGVRTPLGSTLDGDREESTENTLLRRERTSP